MRILSLLTLSATLLLCVCRPGTCECKPATDDPLRKETAQALPPEYREGFQYAEYAAGEIGGKRFVFACCVSLRGIKTLIKPTVSAFLLVADGDRLRETWRSAYQCDWIPTSVELFYPKGQDTVVIAVETHVSHASIGEDILRVYRYDGKSTAPVHLLTAGYINGNYATIPNAAGGAPAFLVYDPMFMFEQWNKFPPQRYRFRAYVPSQSGGYRLSVICTTKRYDKADQALEDVRSSLAAMLGSDYTVPTTLRREK